MMKRVLIVLLTLAATVSASSLLDSEEGVWNWIPMDFVCRDGSTSGIGFRKGPTNAVMFYLQGGGFCFNAETCEAHDKNKYSGSSFTEERFDEWVTEFGFQGIFNAENPSNPVEKWSHVYLPNCSGDLFSGAVENITISGVAEPLTFQGYSNVGKVLDLVAPHFPSPENIMVVAVSAGGIGGFINYPQIVEAFGGRSVSLVIDSTPLLPEVFGIKTSCFYQDLITVHNTQLPVDCQSCADPAKGGFINLYEYLSVKYPLGHFALTCYNVDNVIVSLYERISSLCGGASGISVWFNFPRALQVLRDEYIGNIWATYIPFGLMHTVTTTDLHFYHRRLFNGPSAAEWLGRIDEDPPLHV